MALIEVDGCIYDEAQLRLAHGFESLDPVGREAFVNHIHIDGDDRHVTAGRIIESWVAEMRSRWPGRAFRIYKHSLPTEVVLRFHLVRPDAPHWCEQGSKNVSIHAVK